MAVELLIQVNYTEWVINYSYTALHYNGTERPFIIVPDSHWRMWSNSYSSVGMDTVINHSHILISAFCWIWKQWFAFIESECIWKRVWSFGLVCFVDLLAAINHKKARRYGTQFWRVSVLGAKVQLFNITTFRYLFLFDDRFMVVFHHW